MGEKTQVREASFACLAEPLGYVPKDDIPCAVKAIVRENGRRDDRKYGIRMKYLIDSWGIEKFRSEVEKYFTVRNSSLPVNCHRGMA